jgi:two-component system response regulator DesR
MTTTAPIRVLCVDDNRLIADAMQRRFAIEQGLQWLGWIGDGREALSEILRQQPNVVMLDIDMPGSDSFELLQRVVAAAPETRVLMFSGHIRTDYINKAVDGGAWGYISKNENIEEILSAIRRVAAGEFVVTADVDAEIRRAQ